MVPDGDFLASFRVLYFSEPRAARFRPVSEIRTKTTPCADIQSATAENYLGKKIEERKKKKPQGKNIMSASATQGGHKTVIMTN